MLRSAEMYLNGVENAVMRENMNSGGNFRPNECIISNGNMTCGSTSVEVEVDGEVPKDGTIVFENGKITSVTLNYESGTIIKDESGNLVYEGSVSKSICTLASDSTVAEGLEGAKYNCKVDPNKPEYTFYLLDNNEDGTSDLIMNANINASGEAVIPGVISEGCRWISHDRYLSLGGVEGPKCNSDGECTGNLYGPVTAMECLHNATKSWTNVKPLNYEYYDREYQGIDLENAVDKEGRRTGYQSFVSINGIATITAGDIDGTQIIIGTATEPLRARMPIYSSVASITEVASSNGNNEYLFENLVSCGVYGYWTLSSYADNFYRVWAVDVLNWIGHNDINLAPYETGVRPVITLKI